MSSSPSSNARARSTPASMPARPGGSRLPCERLMVREVVKRLRRKLGDDADTPAYIFTEPRVGYRMGGG